MVPLQSNLHNLYVINSKYHEARDKTHSALNADPRYAA